MLRLCKLLWLLSLVLASKASTNFLQVPENVNSILHSRAQFVCRISSADLCYLFWRISGGSEGMHVNSLGLSSTLTLDASITNNGTQIECGCQAGNNADYTSTVVLRVQGLLDPPTGLRSESTISAIQLSWNPPSSLDLPDQTEVSGYIVMVENDNTGDSRNFTSNVPMFTFMREDFVHCDAFRVRVLGLNSLGEGRQSEHIMTTFVGPTLHAELPNVSLNFGESATLNCSAPCNTTILWFVNDLLAQETNRQHCTSDGFRTESFAVYTEVNETAVLCAAVSVCLDHINCTCHSRKAYITVIGEGTERPSTHDINDSENASHSVTVPTHTIPSAVTEVSVATVQAPSNITGTTKTNTSAEDPLAPTENETALKIGVGAAVAGCVFMLCIVLLLLAVMMMMLKCYRRQRTPNTDNSSKGTQDEAPVNAPIYESSSQVQNYVREDSNNPSPYYSIPLPTDACVAYGAMKLRQ